MLLFPIFVFTLLSFALAAEDPGCVITDTACPCAVRPSSGTCMRHQGSNECLLGECNDGYKCDCFAFEQCTKSPCSIFTTAENAIPSLDTRFQCHLTPNAGTCIVFANFLDTVSSADSAKAESITTVRESNTDMTETSAGVQKILDEKLDLDGIVKEIDSYAEEVSEEERNDIVKEVETVLKAMRDAQAETVALQEDMAEVSKANYEVTRYRRICRVKENEAVQKEAEEKAESKKADNKVECARCAVLKAEVKRLRKERREAAILAGTWTKKAQAAKDRNKRRRKNVEKLRLTAEEARARCVARAEKILARLRG